ncbi:hypothetical protein E2P81_ATG05672 [Venturia nashicola]|uniref:Uncharacterized protein n=1 Tax=Venturia nashicola TaxID=86259 RepID=A0A4Z1PAS7_9PEZI|nr:hypothetical protein E6O75_ATG05812 [Venturia nashicola]TLD29378.1 hypothetical protein E2P81_ATG05672 [Venturia nashicola]
MVPQRSSYEMDDHTSHTCPPHVEHTDSLIESSQGSILESVFEGLTNVTQSAKSVDGMSHHRKVKALRADGWIWEILSLLTACASLIGFMFLLKKYDNQASPQWPHGLSLNTVVSVMSTMFRINVLVPVAAGMSQMGWIWLARRERRLDDISCFDAASRGPWGCLRLLGRTKFGHLASLGAWLSIACLALGPFFQQAVRYDQRSATDATKIAATTVSYSYNGARDSTKGGLPGAGFPVPINVLNVDSRMPHNLRAAMFNAIFTSNLMSLPDPLYSCPTGNCTWDPFRTLGVSTSCFNISSEVSLAYGDFIANSSDGYKMVPSNTSILGDLLNDTDSQTFMKLRSIVPTANSSYMAPFAKVSGILAVVEWAKVLARFANAVTGVGAHVTQNTTFEAHRCLFYFAIHELGERVVNGTYQVNQTAQFTEATKGKMNSLVYKPAPHGNATNRHRDFTVSQESFDIISSQFTMDPNFLQGKVEVSNSSSLNGPTIAFTLFQADNVTKAMYNLADYMTKSFRANDSLLLQAQGHGPSFIAESQMIIGRALSPQQVVHVQWSWLVLPIVVLLLTAVFLGVVILTSTACDVGAWKDSPLTLFFHAMEGVRDDGGRTEDLDTTDAMNKAASRMRVRVRKGDWTVDEAD